MTGNVFNIQRFSIHDGPGIRTTVFMKGCPLRCSWCSNPESQRFEPQLIVRDVKCVRCGACAAVCPEGAITLDGEQGRRIDWERCTQCLQCVPACIYESLGVIGRLMTVEEVLDEVVRDRVFYKNSGGGMTVSGGEAMSQYEFVTELLGRARALGLHTALDTTGFAPLERYEALLPVLDLLMMDVKTLDPALHREFTGVDNERILANAAALAPRVRTWFRIPLIAGFNDSAREIRELAALASRLGVDKVSLLPYHEGGRSKAGQIGGTYRMDGASAPDDEHTQRLIEIIAQAGVAASIGH
ncbi:MAG: glycyl-radical enzyme activating protein [Proteobacteria bacterium]|nr:glycyl-radical enzyme activating protein [Pseudomonadota bacterium]